MANIAYIAASLDGFIATQDGGLNWLNEIPNPTKSDYGFNDFMKGIDALVMGRNTYEVVLSFGQWPYRKKVFVLSGSLEKVDDSLAENAEVINGDLKQIVFQLNKKGFKNLYIDGGKTIQNFLKQNLIDELIITRVPIILGCGIPLFGTQNHKLRLKHCFTEIFENGLVKSHYKKIEPNPLSSKF